MAGGILVGDVGGTNVRFAVANRHGSGIEIDGFQKLAGDDFGAFDEALARYIDQSGQKVERACFALAGPVQQGEVLLTNRQWRVSAARLQKRFDFADVRLINDFTAMARSVPEHDAAAFENVLPGTPNPDAPVIVAGPGTGFGVATLLRKRTGGWRVMNGEGGHMAFAPRTDLEFDVAKILMDRFGYVSNELVASGMGLEPVHEAFCQVYDRAVEDISPEDMRKRADAGDDMFHQLILMRACVVMGAVGDLVLSSGALGGVVLAGGVSERIVDYLRMPEAVNRFRERGPMSSYLADCPVDLMHDPEAPLVGAAAFYEQEFSQ
ncbi:MAG: glucokinase [Hyphomonas sp.]|nr:glucokinase [Hyphomonas sp.]